MPISGTQRDLLSHLDYITREFDPEKLERYTTAAIARTLSISRNLASQYPNELVRSGFVVKAGVRPIYFFHRHGLERYVQARITERSYASVDELLALHNDRPGEGFDRAVGHALSLSSAVEQMRVAMGYPPCGLPVLILGAPGTGKTYLVGLMLEHGKKAGLLDTGAKITTIDCSRLTLRSGEIEREYRGWEGHPGWRDRARGGLLLFKYIDQLGRAEREFLFTHALLAARAEQGMGDRGVRFVFTSSAPADSEFAYEFQHRLPVVVSLPSFCERTPEERGEFVLRFLKDEGRRMGVDVLISQGAFNCLISADYDDNISELRRSVTNACAEAYLERSGGNSIEVRTFRLPANVLGRVHARQAEGSAELIDTTRIVEHCAKRSLNGFVDPLIEAYGAFKQGSLTDAEMFGRTAGRVRDLEDYLASGHGARGARVEAYGRLIAEVVADVNDEFSAELSGATSRLLAQLLYAQLWPDDQMLRWKVEHRAELVGIATLLSCAHVHPATLFERIVTRTRDVLGVEADVLTRLVMLAHIALLESGGVLASQVALSGPNA